MKTSINLSQALLIGAIPLVALLTACDSADTTDKVNSAATEAVMQNMTDSEVEVSKESNGNQGETLVLTQDGEEMKISSGSDLTLPASFPDDIPLPENMVLTNVTEISNDGITIQGHAAGDINTMVERTKQDALEAGWSDSFSTKQGQMTMVTMDKGDRGVIYSITELEPSRIEIEGHNLVYTVMTQEN